MCGKNQFCQETDPEYCAECYTRYIQQNPTRLSNYMAGKSDCAPVPQYERGDMP